MAVNGGVDIFNPKKLCPSIIKNAPHCSGWLIKAFWSEAMCLCKKNIHISVSFVENMLVSQEPSFVYSNIKPVSNWLKTKSSIHHKKCSTWLHFFMMDGLTFLGFKISTFAAIIKLGRARTFFFIKLCLYSPERRKSYSLRIAWGWVNHGVILILGWTIPWTSNYPI